MAQWIEDLYECDYYRHINILRFGDYSSYNHSKIRKFPEESDIVSLIGVRSKSIDVFILLKEGKFDNISEDTLFIQTNDFKRLVLSDRYNDVFYKGDINSINNYYAFELLGEYKLISVELLRFIEDTKEYIENNWRKKNEDRKD